MRLINIQHGMSFEEFNEPNIPSYVILSHTWEDEEISYAEASISFNSSIISPIIRKAGFEKIKQFAAVARELRFEYIWIDTCCIDKSSSAELSEAINSMYRWYRNSSLCIIYLADVPELPSRYHLPAIKEKFNEEFKQTRWLTRGWTLQEFLAQPNRRYYSMNWKQIQLPTNIIAKGSGIPIEAINGFRPERWSVAQKMSWAANRKTTRIEDRAYSLLGIFNVNMPLIYGEGDSAFRRLQEEILKNSTDHTIFCWTSSKSSYSMWRGLFARSPSEFANSGDILENKRLNAQPFHLTNKGIQMSLKLLPTDLTGGDFIALLQCNRLHHPGQCGIYIQRIHDDNYIRVVSNVVVEVPSTIIRTTKPLVEMLFVKPELVGMIWRKSDTCPRIAGFRFLEITNSLSDLLNVWIDKVTPKEQFSWESGIFLFPMDPNEKDPSSAVARCHLESVSGCSMEIWVKYDWRKKYGEEDEQDEMQNEANDIMSSNWRQSECCEWKVQGKTCNMFEMSISSWIELDDESNAHIHVEFFDSGNHYYCYVEETADSMDVISSSVKSLEEPVHSHLHS